MVPVLALRRPGLLNRPTGQQAADVLQSNQTVKKTDKIKQ